MSSEFNENSYSLKMDKSIHSLKKDISTLRTGRANPNMLDTVKVDVYGQIASSPDSDDNWTGPEYVTA